jgi:hypothetical protein
MLSITKMKLKLLSLIIILFNIISPFCNAQSGGLPPSDIWTGDTLITTGKNIKLVTDSITEMVNGSIVKNKALTELIRYNKTGKPILDSLRYKYRIIQYRQDGETLLMEKYVNKNEKVYREVFYNEKGIKTRQVDYHGRAKNISYYNLGGDENRWVFVKDSIKADSGKIIVSLANNGHTKISVDLHKNVAMDSSSITYDDAGRIISTYQFNPESKDVEACYWSYSADGKLTEKKDSGITDGRKYVNIIIYAYAPANASGDIKMTEHSSMAGDSLNNKIVIKNTKGQIVEDSSAYDKRKYYYNNDKLVKVETYKDDILTVTDELTYDSNGLLLNVKSAAKDPDSGDVHVTLYNYHYEYY